MEGFKSETHKNRFIEIMHSLGKVYGGRFDPEYSAALYLLTADLSIWRKVSSYVSRDGIYIDTVVEEVDLSGGYAVLVKLAGNLFNDQQHIDPLEFLRLDDDNFDLALTAIKLRRYGFHAGQE